MTYKDILYCYKSLKRDYNDFNVHYKSGKNGTRTKSDKQKELVVYELRSIINKKFNSFKKEFKYNNANYPNIKNILTNDKLHMEDTSYICVYYLEGNEKFKQLQKEYLMTLMTENDKNTLETYSNLVNNHLDDDDDRVKNRVTRNYLDFINLLKEDKYDMRSWNNSWVKIKNPKPLKISNLYDTFVPKEFLINNPRKYILWKR